MGHAARNLSAATHRRQGFRSFVLRYRLLPKYNFEEMQEADFEWGYIDPYKGVSKNRGSFPTQNGWWKFHGKPHEQMDDLGG